MTSKFNTPISRRSALLAGAGITAASALAACGSDNNGGGGSGGSDPDAPIVFAMFGDAAKVERREAAFNTYLDEHPDAPATFMGTPSDAWPDKIATMFASGNAPDAINLSAGDGFTYADRGVLAPLDSVDGFEPENFSEAVLNLGRDLDGTLYGAPVAASTQAVLYNETLLERLGLSAPTGEWTWDQYLEFSQEIYDASNGEVHGTQDLAQTMGWLQLWLRSQGGLLFGEDGVAASVDELIEWFRIWDDARSSGACATAELSAAWTPGSWPNSPVVKGKAALAFVAVQELTGGYQALMEDTCKLTSPPTFSAGGSTGIFSQPSSSMYLNAKSENPELAVEIINFFVSAPAPAQVLRLISGPPAANTALAAVRELDDLSATDQIVLDYAIPAFEDMEPISTPELQANTGPMVDLFRRTNEDIAFGNMSVEEAAQNFIDQAASTLGAS